MKKPLREQYADSLKEIRDERDRNWKLQERISEIEKELKQIQDRSWDFQRQIAQAHTRLDGANGHLAGMREILIGYGFMKEPQPKEPPKVCPNCRHQDRPPEMELFRQY